MRPNWLKIWIWIALLGAGLNFTPRQTEPVALQYPASWPAPHYDFSKNPLTKQGIALGRQLFYDPILSRDSTISCASCHLSYTAFTHVDHALSHGIDDRVGTRNSPALTNLAWSSSFMWDGAIQHLDFQALAPVSHPSEMDSDLATVVAKLAASKRYVHWFASAFDSPEVTGERVLKALAQFELTLISANSTYDQVMAGTKTFSVQEQQGYELFKQHCDRCHTEPLFTHSGFEKNGLPLDTVLNDWGRMGITHLTADSLAFKVPSLRNIEFSYPYMHDGRFRKLSEVLLFYAKNESMEPRIQLSPNERTDVMAFLRTLTDRESLFNPDYAFPRK